MSKRRGGSLPRVMPSLKRSGLDIRMAVPGPPIVPPDPLAVSLGGTETAGLQLAAELVRQGHRVTVGCNTPEPFEWRGVRLQRWLDPTEASDLLLIQNEGSFLPHGSAATARFVWLHNQPTSKTAVDLMAYQQLADRLVFVSRWQAAQFGRSGIDERKILVARNGIDLKLIAEATAGVERDPFRIVYASRPERGLEVLLRALLPSLLEAEPRASLHIASYAVLENGLTHYYRQLRELSALFGDRVIWHEPQGKRGLYRLMAGGGLYLYPTPAPIDPGFAETSCICAMEAMACGLPWVSTDRGALPETVGDAGVLVPLGGAPHAGEPAVLELLADAAWAIMTERDHADRLRQAGLARAQSLGWGPVAEQIVAATMAVIEEKARKRTSSSALKPVRAPERPAARIMVATPVYGRMVHMEFCSSLLLTAERLRDDGHSVGWLTNSMSSIQHARNDLAAGFLATDATHLMWIDADVSFPADAVSRLLAHDLDVVAGLYPAKQSPPSFFFTPARDGQGRIRLLPSGLVEAAEADGGFTLVRREVYLTLMQTLPERAVPQMFGPSSRCAPWLYDFYPTSVDGRMLQGEDLGFCHLWRSIGGEIWVDPSIGLTHHGMYGYTGDPMTLIAPAPRVGEAA